MPNHGNFVDMSPYLVLIPALPLAASVLTGLLGPRLLRQYSHWPCILAAIASCALSVLVLLAISRVASWDQSGKVPGVGATFQPAPTKVGVSMLPRGEFSFIVASEGTGLGVASQILYPLAGLTTLITSVLSSVGMRLLKKRAEKVAEATVSARAKKAAVTT